MLYIKGGTKPDKFMTGGHQERTMRGGTTNVPGVVGMAAALEKAVTHLDENYNYVKSLRDRFVKRVKEEIPYVVYNGHETDRLPPKRKFCFRVHRRRVHSHVVGSCGYSVLFGFGMLIGFA